MSRKKKKNSTSAPPPPVPSNSYYYEGNVLRSSSVFDPSRNAYVTQTHSTPSEVEAQRKLQQNYNNYLSQLEKSGPEQAQRLKEFESSIFAQSRKPLDEEYQRGMSQAKESFNASGFMNSTGFEDYRMQNLDKLYQEGLQQASVDAKLAREQLARDFESQLMQKFGLTADILNANASSSLSTGAFPQAGVNSLNQFNQQNYNELLNQLRSQRMQRESSFGQATVYNRFLQQLLGTVFR